MQSLLSLALVVFVAAAGADEDCSVYKFPANECCPVADLFPDFKKVADDKCKIKNFMGKPMGSKSEIKAAYYCIVECSFEKEGLLDADKKLNKAAITTFLTPTDPSLAPAIVSEVIDKCFDSIQTNSSLECTSGSFEYIKCFKRQLLLNCPSSRWTATPECEDIKAKSVKCPNVPVVLIK